MGNLTPRSRYDHHTENDFDRQGRITLSKSVSLTCPNLVLYFCMIQSNVSFRFRFRVSPQRLQIVLQPLKR